MKTVQCINLCTILCKTNIYKLPFRSKWSSRSTENILLIFFMSITFIQIHNSTPQLIYLAVKSWFFPQQQQQQQKIIILFDSSSTLTSISNRTQSMTLVSIKMTTGYIVISNKKKIKKIFPNIYTVIITIKL